MAVTRTCANLRCNRFNPAGLRAVPVIGDRCQLTLSSGEINRDKPPAVRKKVINRIFMLPTTGAD
jgi:hypothetical protein